MLVACGLVLVACSSSGDNPGRAPAVASTGPVNDPAGNKALAKAAVDKLIGELTMPSGSLPLTGPHPAALDDPGMGIPDTDHYLDVVRFWTVPLRASEMYPWVLAHRPPGFSESGNSGSGTGYQAQPISIELDGFNYPNSNNPPPQLIVTSVSDGAKSTWRVDATDIWHDPTPVKVQPVSKTVHITIAAGCPTSFPSFGTGISNTAPGLDDELLPAGAPTKALVCQYQGMNPPPVGQADKHWSLDASQASNVADQIRKLTLGPLDGVYNCPMDDGRFIVIVFAMPQADIDIMWRNSGCPVVSNGHIEALMGYLTIPGA